MNRSTDFDFDLKKGTKILCLFPNLGEIVLFSISCHIVAPLQVLPLRLQLHISLQKTTTTTTVVYNFESNKIRDIRTHV